MRTIFTVLKITLLTLVAAVTVQAQPANPPKLTALVIEAAGKAIFFKEGSTERAQVQVKKTRLEEGYIILTGGKSSVKLLIEGKTGPTGGEEPAQTTVEIKERSRVKLAELFADLASGGEKIGVGVSEGQVIANVRKIDPTSERFEVQTPTAVAAVRGTKFSANVEKTGQMKPKVKFRVYRGKIDIFDPKTRKHRRLLDEGDTLDIEPSGTFIQGSMGGTSQTGQAGGIQGGPGMSGPGGPGGQFAPGEHGDENDEDSDTGTFPERSDNENDDTGGGPR